MSLLVAVFSAALVSATEYRDVISTTKHCIYSRYSNAKEDRMWIFMLFMFESAQYLNDWKESDEDEYLVGWYSDFDGGKDDRRFKMKYRKLATDILRSL